MYQNIELNTMLLNKISSAPHCIKSRIKPMKNALEICLCYLKCKRKKPCNVHRARAYTLKN